MTASHLRIDPTDLKQALEFHDQGFTPWNEERELFIAGARQLLSTLQREEQLREALELCAEFLHRMEPFAGDYKATDAYKRFGPLSLAKVKLSISRVLAVNHEDRNQYPAAAQQKET